MINKQFILLNSLSWLIHCWSKWESFQLGEALTCVKLEFQRYSMIPCLRIDAKESGFYPVFQLLSNSKIRIWVPLKDLWRDRQNISKETPTVKVGPQICSRVCRMARWPNGWCAGLWKDRSGFEPLPGTLCWHFTLTCSASLHPGVWMGTGELNAGGKPVTPIQRGVAIL